MDRASKELAVGVAIGAVGVLVTQPAAFSTSGFAMLALLLIGIGPLAWKGLRLTLVFFSGLSNSNKHGRIDGYNDQYDDKKTDVDGRNKDYANLVDSFYDLATEFYEWGWGASFHFADRRSGETFHQSILRHEYFLAGRLNISKGAKILDCGCGIGGPARNIARFTGANIKAITINQFQVNRGNTLCAKEGISDQVELICADFMKMPFEDNSFDAVYAIESTCHAPDRAGVYSEIKRVLKPGGVFACYEWCVTDEFDKNNAEHMKIKKDIEVGDGLPDLVHTSVCTKALKEAGFEVSEARDAMKDGFLGEEGEPWYVPLTPSWNPTKWPRFQFNPIMFRLTPVILKFFEAVGLLSPGSAKTQVMLQAGGIGCGRGGELGVFTPAWLMVGRKPL